MVERATLVLSVISLYCLCRQWQKKRCEHQLQAIAAREDTHKVIWTSLECTHLDKDLWVSLEYETWSDFGASDVPLSNEQWTELEKQNIKAIQLPVGLSPMNFFVSIPAEKLPEGKAKLSPCTVVKIFTVSERRGG
eukprot:1146356-Pelagomonas_calceolata.AAC.3